MKILSVLFFVLSLAACGKGPIGPAGPQGPAGATGAPGASCTVSTVSDSPAAPNGGSLISCPDGTTSLVLNGTDGTNGTNGSNGTVVAAVQFCSGTPSYPSTFPEIGFCIDNTLYAVYSANDGFLTEVTPGEYSSDGENSSCDFTVGANCQVTQD